MQYNTKRKKLIMPEYGRNLQSMVDYVRSIEDPEKRQQQAQVIIELMGILNPHLKNVDDFKHKLWDHLFRISEFDLDVKSPYNIPTAETLSQKPAPLPYPQKKLKYRHLGRNISNVMDKAVAEPDAAKRGEFSQAIAYCMKLAYSNWHNEPVHEDMVREELHEISDGLLTYEGASGRVRHYNNNTNQQNNNNRRTNYSNNNNTGTNNNNNRNQSNNRNNQQHSANAGSNNNARRNYSNNNNTNNSGTAQNNRYATNNNRNNNTNNNNNNNRRNYSKPNNNTQ